MVRRSAKETTRISKQGSVKKGAPTSFQVWQPKMMTQLRTLRVPFATGLLAASLAAALLLLGDYVPAFATIKESSFDTSAYTSFASLIAFMTVFRTGQAYERFAEGTMLIHQILGDWHDATSTLVAFCRYSEADKELVVSFQQKLVRLMSLLNAMILGELEGDDQVEKAATRWELIDVSGLDRRLLEMLARSKSRPEIVFQWVQNEIVDNVKTGVLSIPPPLLTRAFQELANGMMKYHDAAKFARVPFPLPYTVVVELLLAMYAVVTPIVMSSSSEQVGWGALFSFVLVFVVWSMHFLALELENPYGADANDLDMSEIQCDLNRHLVAALVHGQEKAELMVGSDEAVFRIKTQFRRRGSASHVAASLSTSFSSLGLALKSLSSSDLTDISDGEGETLSEEDQRPSVAAVEICDPANPVWESEDDSSPTPADELPEARRPGADEGVCTVPSRSVPPFNKRRSEERMTSFSNAGNHGRMPNLSSLPTPSCLDISSSELPSNSFHLGDGWNETDSSTDLCPAVMGKDRSSL